MINNIIKAHGESKRLYGFIDEFGNYGFDFSKDGVSSHFIVTAILIEESKIDKLESEVSLIRDKYFRNGEIKSSKLSKNDKRRFSLVSEVAKLDFKFVSLIVDKREIFGDSGLRYKDPFTKYLPGILYKELYTSFPKLQLVADQIGKKEYMDRFREYVLERNEPNFFNDYEFGFDNSKSNTIIQLADVVSGVLALNFDENKIIDDYEKYHKLLSLHQISLYNWPIRYEAYIHKFEKLNKGKYDHIVLLQTMKLVDKFIKENEESLTLDIKEQVFVLKYLKSVLLSRDTDKYILSNELINNLKYVMSKNVTKDHLRTNVIAKLRDSGVIISSSHNGYKIPVNEKELNDYVNQSNSTIAPMLARIKKCRDRILLATEGELDILSHTEFRDLKKLLDEAN